MQFLNSSTFLSLISGRILRVSNVKNYVNMACNMSATICGCHCYYLSHTSRRNTYKNQLMLCPDIGNIVSIWLVFRGKVSVSISSLLVRNSTIKQSARFYRPINTSSATPDRPARTKRHSSTVMSPSCRKWLDPRV